MRYAGLLLVMMFVLCPVSEAKTMWGAKGGLSLARQEFDYSGQQDLDVSRRTGLAGGLFREWGVTRRLSVVLEGMYVQRGMQLDGFLINPDGPEPFRTVSTGQRVDYLSLPVLLKMRFELGNWGLYGAAGPRFDRMLGYEASLGFEEVYRGFAQWDVGSDLVIGVDNARTLLEVRYGITLTTSYDTELLDVTNNTVLILAGLYF